MSDVITFERARDVLDAYGGDPARWPDGERAALSALIATTPELEALQRSALELDRRLDAAKLAPPDARLAAAITARLSEAAARRSRASSIAAPRWAPMAAAAALTLGLGLGWLGSAATTADPLAEESLYASAFGALTDRDDWTGEGALEGAS